MIATQVLDSLRDRSGSSALPREFYTDAEIFNLDLEHIFYREWLLIAYTAELPRSGSALTLQIGAYGVRLARGPDGNFRAYVNGGRKARARGRTDMIHPSRRQIRCETVSGCVFVCLAAQPPDFGPTRRQLDLYLFPHRLPEARVAFESTTIEEGNWKLICECAGAASSLKLTGVLLLCHYPTSWSHLLSDQAICVRVLPLAPTRTALTLQWLVHRDAVEGVDYDAEDLPQAWHGTSRRQRQIERESESGVKCGEYEQMAPPSVTDNGARQFLDWYCRRLGRRLAPGRMLNPARRSVR